MGKSKTTFDNSKKAQGNARKQEAAELKRQQELDKLAAQEAAEWEDGAKKKNSKKEAEAEKKAEAARKKAERDLELKKEAESVKNGKPEKQKAKGNARAATRQVEIPDFDSAVSGSEPALVASGIDDALDALNITTGVGSKIDVDRHPERRYKGALAKFEERRLPEFRKEHPGLRLNQYKQLIKKEFERSDENPFNQLTASYNSTAADQEALKSSYKKNTEQRLAVK